MKLLDTFRKSPLVLLAAIVQAGAFALAGSVYFGPFGWGLGAAAGVVVNLSMALAASRISEIAKVRRGLAWGAFAVLFCLSPLAVAPAEYLLLTAHTATLPPLLLIAVAVVWSILPDAAIIAAGGVTGKSLVVSEQVAQPAPQRERKAKKLPRNHIDRAQLMAQLRRNPPPSNAEIAQVLGVTRQAVSKARQGVTLPEMVEK